MEAKDQRKSHSIGSESPGVHVCSTCGWQYPKQHPSAKHRRAHKKICGTIKGYELLSGLEDGHCGDDEHKTLSPKLGDKSKIKIDGIGAISSKSEQDLFEDAACEFSSSEFGLRSDSLKANEDQATMEVEKFTKNPDEIQQSKSSSMACEMKNSEVSDSCVDSSEAMFGSSEVAQFIDESDTVKDVRLETNTKGKGRAFAEGNSSDASNVMWNDDVIYSEVEGPNELTLEKSDIIEYTEEESIGCEDDSIDTSVVKGNAAEEIALTESTLSVDNVPLFVPDDIPLMENAEWFKGHKEMNLNLNQSAIINLQRNETDTVDLTEITGIQSGQLSIEMEASSSDILLLEDKNEQQGQDDSVMIEGLSINEHVLASKIDNEDGSQPEESIITADFEIESPSDTVQISDVSANVNHTANRINMVNLSDHKNELIRVKDETKDGSMETITEGNNIQNNLISESSGVTDVCESNNESQSERSGALMADNSPVKITNTEEEDAMNHFGSTVITSDAVQTSDQELPKSERTDFHRVLGGLGVIQGNEINSNDKTQECCFTEVPVAIESNDRRDFGRLKNLSEAHIKSLVPSLVASTNTYNNASVAANGVKCETIQSEENDSEGDSLKAKWGSVSELKKSDMKASIDGSARSNDEKSYTFVSPYPAENLSHPSASDASALSKNQEITERITNWNMEKQQQQHVPLKNLLSEARSPQLEAVNNKNCNSSDLLPRVSSILGSETSPDSCFPAKGEVSEEWKTPARYPVDVKREEKRGKNRPFWVPFVCCSSVN